MKIEARVNHKKLPWLGVLGGGQLGKMFVQAAQTMGYKVMVLDPDGESPAVGVADKALICDYSDLSALQKMADNCAAITTEFENVPAETLRLLSKNLRVCPQARAVEITQNRILEKQFLVDIGVPVVPFCAIRDESDIADSQISELFPGILKRARFGYDGKGQATVADAEDLRVSYDRLGRVACVMEKKMELDMEVSIILARRNGEEVKVYPVAENRHSSGILDLTVAPARTSSTIENQAKKLSLEIASKLEYQGVMCVEFFLLKNGELVVNEIAPRPHNSGHYTIDACFTSQFEQQVRVLCDLPLGDSNNHTPAAMVNLLGDLWVSGEPDWGQVLKTNPRAKLHLYGKNQARAGRKMGHIVFLDRNIDDAYSSAVAARSGLIPVGNNSE